MLLSFLTYKFISPQPQLPSPNKAQKLSQYLTQNSELSTKEEEEATMFSSKRLAQMAKKWERMAALGKKNLLWTTSQQVDECCMSGAVKGHCIMYTTDGRRFEVPLAYLGTTIIGELLRMSQEEFGFSTDGRITLPCDAVMLDYVMCLLRRNASEEVEIAFLSFVTRPCHSDNGLEQSMRLTQHIAVSSF